MHLYAKNSTKRSWHFFIIIIFFGMTQKSSIFHFKSFDLVVDFLSCYRAVSQGSTCQFTAEAAVWYFTPSFLETQHSNKQPRSRRKERESLYSLSGDVGRWMRWREKCATGVITRLLWSWYEFDLIHLSSQKWTFERWFEDKVWGKRYFFKRQKRNCR